MAIDELSDNQLIRDRKGGTPSWVYLAVIAALAALLWGGASQIFDYQQRKQAGDPFLQVTNREFSLFLWQFPEYMRANVSSKAGYLPGFQYGDKITIEPGQAEDYVSAPPEVIFLFHAWKRLVADDFIPRQVRLGEFQKFLDYSPEWLSENWPGAPAGYAGQLADLKGKAADTVIGDLPLDVQKAFIGWKNFFIEGDLINKEKPTYQDMVKFLDRFPHYSRNYWRNLVTKGKPDYLKSIFLNKFDPKAAVPEAEMAAFLRVAYFNFAHAS